ncbi:LysR family transcriptional regulator [Amycolatopsis sp. WAC 04197]|uniref:LysR family transcriptional regulator n=1 Tax=Amycolatopsis sp. WAC 04197 TaxID=2203199 RepID=UPI000F7768A5|nr:LysR family transcriptional regulator [Amycolatopsis sp. WAC 04197]RSN45182.1 LysR family transcriptional regulator [Amycolatopsis sp. WAC 04197]
MSDEWSRIDLNLLLPLNALLTERNVTRAAERLSMTQPSMSAILARLRRHFDDPLLVREGRGLVLTPLGESLRGPTRVALATGRAALTTGQSFEPTTDERTFTMMASDYVATTLLRPMIGALATQAPGVRFVIHSPQPDPAAALRNRTFDLVLWPLDRATHDLLEFPHTKLFSDEFVLAADQANRMIDEPMTPDGLSGRPVVVVDPSGEGTAALHPIPIGLGMHGSAAITVPTFALALEFLAGTELVAIVQRRLFKKAGPALGLREIPLSDSPPRATIAGFSHPRDFTGQAGRWLHSRLAEAASLL